MKFGIRTPSPSKSISARTKGRVNRGAKNAINPFYGRKGAGIVKSPKRAAYNKVYNKTTYSAYGTRTGKRTYGRRKDDGTTGCLVFLIVIVIMIALFINPVGTILAVVIGGPILLLLTPIISIIYIIISSITYKRRWKKYEKDNYIKSYMPDDF